MPTKSACGVVTILAMVVLPVIVPRSAICAAEDKEKVTTLALSSGYSAKGLLSKESGARSIRLTATLNDKGDGEGTLALDPNNKMFDRLGNATATTLIGFDIQKIKFDQVQRDEKREDGRKAFEIKDHKLDGQLILVTPAKGGSTYRLLFVGEKDKVLEVVLLEAEAKKDEKPKPSKLEPYQCGKVERLHTFDGIFLASQPTADDFKLAAENGIKTVINLRETDEIEWDEEGQVKKLNMEYVHVPFKSPTNLTDKEFDKVREVLKNKDKKPILLHCSSANRVGAMWLVHRVMDHNVSYEDALKEAETVGLKTPALTEKSKDYIDRKKGK